MCSTAEERLAGVRRAIDELAAASAAGSDADTQRLVQRLAWLWAMMADLDPEMARRLAGYDS